jgi:hypothetical protein
MRKNVGLIGLVIVLLFLIGITWKNREGFATYNDCIQQGYTKEFCVQSPTSVMGPAVCMCDNGLIGKRLVGFRGECICDSRLF